MRGIFDFIAGRQLPDDGSADFLAPDAGLADFAPIVSFKSDAPFQSALNASTVPMMELAMQQADALDGVWDAFAEDLNIDLPDAIPPFHPGDLKDIFLTHSARMGVLQFQTPAIVPSSGAFNMVSLFSEPQYRHLRKTIFWGSFNDRIDIGADEKSVYSVLTILRHNLGRREVLALPTSGLPEWMLPATITDDYARVLRAFQRMVARVGHEYFHQMTAADDGIYFNRSMLHRKRSVPKNLFVTYYRPAREVEKAWTQDVDAALGRINSDLKADEDGFEVHALLTHRRVFAQMWKSPAFAKACLDDIEFFVAGIAQTKSPSVLRSQKAFAYAAFSIMGSYLLRAVSPTHKMVRHFKNCIDRQVSFTIQDMAEIIDGNVNEELAGAKSASQKVMWNVLWLANGTYGNIHHGPLRRLDGQSRARAQHEMGRARQAKGLWPTIKVY